MLTAEQIQAKRGTNFLNSSADSLRVNNLSLSALEVIHPQKNALGK
jgi:hypothetical protein